MQSEWLYLHRLLEGVAAQVPAIDKLSLLDLSLWREILAADDYEPITRSSLLSLNLASLSAVHKSLKILIGAGLIKEEKPVANKEMCFLIKGANCEKTLASLEYAMHDFGSGLLRQPGWLISSAHLSNKK